VIETAGQMGSVEVFLNFMIMDINRNALRKNRDLAIQRSTAVTSVCATGRITFCVGVRAEGIRLAKVASIWRRNVAEDGIGVCIRLIFVYRIGSQSITFRTDTSAISD
jgi:hypothetical protein